MNLQERINNDMKEAMKAKDAVKLSAIRMLKAAFIQNNTAVKPTDDLSVVISHVKKLQDSLQMFPTGSEAFVQTLNEFDALRPYLPQEMSKSADRSDQSGWRQRHGCHHERVAAADQRAL